MNSKSCTKIQQWSQIIRNSHFQMLFKISVLEIFTKLTRKHLCQGLAFYEIARDRQNNTIKLLKHLFFLILLQNLSFWHHVRSVLLLITGKSGNCAHSANWSNVFKNGPSKIWGRQPLEFRSDMVCNPSNFLKDVFHKFYLVHSWMLCLTSNAGSCGDGLRK